MDTVNILLIVSSFLSNFIALFTVVYTMVQNKKILEESTRPVISIYTDKIDTGNLHFYLIIKNFGKSPAYITKFEYDFDFRGCFNMSSDKDYLAELNHASLAPGQARICVFDYSKINKPVTFHIEYKSGAGKTYKECFTIDLKAAVSLPSVKTWTEGKGLKTISYTLQEMLEKNL